MSGIEEAKALSTGFKYKPKEVRAKAMLEEQEQIKTQDEDEKLVEKSKSPQKNSQLVEEEKVTSAKASTVKDSPSKQAQVKSDLNIHSKEYKLPERSENLAFLEEDLEHKASLSEASPEQEAPKKKKKKARSNKGRKK